jgi:hypothetical protein
MTKSGIHKGNAGELRPLALAFLEAYRAAAVKTDQDFKRVVTADGGYHHFDGGLVELTDHVVKATDDLIDRAIKIIGPKGESERALTTSAEETGKDLIRGDLDLESAVEKLIERFADEANSSFELILPNYLIDFTEGVRSVDMCRIRAVLTEDVSIELKQRDIPVIITQGPELSQSIRARTLHLTMPPRCWVVKVDAARDNAHEEAKWLIDVAVSLLRMSYRIIGPMFPMYGDIEPHPTVPWHLKNISVTIGEKFTTAGKNIAPKSYEIDRRLEAAVTDPAFLARAKLIFDPQKGSLAERLHQGLGWLTRGRQSEDRAERLLYFFTAIEALLSSDDKTAPVVQTIARNAAAILTADVAARARTAKEIRQLYGLRSSVVHTGSRPVAWPQAQLAQKLAKDLFWIVLQKVDLSIKHINFIDQLSFASYGSPWPPHEPQYT